LIVIFQIIFDRYFLNIFGPLIFQIFSDRYFFKYFLIVILQKKWYLLLINYCGRVTSFLLKLQNLKSNFLTSAFFLSANKAKKQSMRQSAVVS